MMLLTVLLNLFYIFAIVHIVKSRDEDEAYHAKREIITNFEFKCESFRGFRWERSGDDATCVSWSRDLLNFENAKRACKRKDSRLAVFKTLPLLQILRRQAQLTRRSYWVGLDDINSQGTYQWHDGSVLSAGDMRRFFYPGQPDNYEGKEDCVAVDVANLYLHDVQCARELYYVCEKVFK